MLDKLPIGEKEERQYLKCEACGLLYNDNVNFDSIDETGKCVHCYDEFGDEEIYKKYTR